MSRNIHNKRCNCCPNGCKPFMWKIGYNEPVGVNPFIYCATPTPTPTPTPAPD